MIFLSIRLPVRHRSFTCHKGHKHKDEDEVKECNRLEERDRHGNVHEQTVVVEGDKSILNQIRKSGQLALEGKIEKKSKDKKH